MSFIAEKLAQFYPNHIDGAADAYQAALDSASETARMVNLTGRLSLPEGVYSKSGGTARMTISKDGCSYTRSDDVTVPLTGVQAERQFIKLGFRVIDGFDQPLVRKSRSVVMLTVTAEDMADSVDADPILTELDDALANIG